MVIGETEEFAAWLAGLADSGAKARILMRIKRLASGNPGDVKPIGGGVSEMRIDYGPGYRVYYVSRGAERAILLLGGTKKRQADAIARARVLAREV